MKRKVVRHGSNTLTVSLPAKWCDKFSVKNGDEVEVVEQENSLIISNEKVKPKTDSITFDISNLDRTSTLILIQGLYRYGYDEITIRADSIMFPHYRIEKEVSVSKVVHDVVNRFIGSELISSSSKSFSIRKITQESMDEFEIVLRRVFRLLNEMMQVFIEGIEKNSIETLESIEFHHINVKKFINYCLRLLNKFGYPDRRKTCFYFSIIQYMSKIDDFIKNASRYITKNKFKISERSINVIKDINHSVNLYYELFYDYDVKKVSNLNQWRDKIRNSFFSKTREFSKDELVILAGFLQIIEILLDMTELRMALEH